MDPIIKAGKNRGRKMFAFFMARRAWHMHGSPPLCVSADSEFVICIEIIAAAL